MNNFHNFLVGAITMGFATTAYFFFRFWVRSKDSFFAVLSIAFTLMGIERVILLFIRPDEELRPYVYLVRLSAFLFILYAIYSKNRGPAAK
ncbi:MAG: DUF5985 family protein [Verrucomicrobiota bacterium]|nr:DUF5985 family protein [Verrucomicrobiota bacterium]